MSFRHTWRTWRKEPLLSGAILGRHCHIGHHAALRDGMVLGDKSTLTEYTRA